MSRPSRRLGDRDDRPGAARGTTALTLAALAAGAAFTGLGTGLLRVEAADYEPVGITVLFVR